LKKYSRDHPENAIEIVSAQNVSSHKLNKLPLQYEQQGAGDNFTAFCKSAVAVAAVPDDPCCIEQGPAQRFSWTKISESRCLSNRKRSNIVPRATTTGQPSSLA
jgi:hypothetical protein